MPRVPGLLVAPLVSLLVSLLVAALIMTVGPVTTASAAAPREHVAPASAPMKTQAPAACGDAAYLWSHLARCGRAGPGSTGPRLKQCPHGLRPLGGSLTSVRTLRRDGQRIQCRAITGCLAVEARNVLIRNVRIRCSSGSTGEAANGSGVIKIYGGASATVVSTAIDAARANHSCIWHEGARMAVRRVDCWGANDGIFSWSGDGGAGNDFRITRSYFHDFTTETANGHVDGYQTEGASKGVIAGNTFLMTSDDDKAANAAISIWNGMRDSRDIMVRGNLIAGGGFAIYAEDYSPSEDSPQGGYVVERVTFRDNLFSRRLYGCVGYWGVWFHVGPTDGWHRQGNRLLETGESLDGGNPSYDGQSCT